MKKTVLAHVIPATVLACIAVPAAATNGYFTHGVGTHSKAMAGAGDAMPDMAIDIANNPASGVLVKDSIDIGLALFSPRREYSASQSQLNGQFGAFSIDAGTVESDNEYFPIPYIAKNWKLDDDRAVTLAFYGRGGMNTDYTSGSATFDPDGPGPAPIMSLPGPFGTGTAGVNLNQAFLEISYSFTVDDISFGIAPVLAYQIFEAEGVGAFAPYTKTFAESGGTVMPQNLTNRGSDSSFGYGIKVGAIWSATDRVALSLAYQSEIKMDEFSKYSDLFAENGGFDIPATARAGISLQATPNVQLHLDVERIYYSDVPSVANSVTAVGGCPTAGMGGMNLENCLGGNQGFGFGWDDVTVYQIGAEWTPASTPGITWRAGYNYGEQPISAEDAVINIFAPAVIEEHFTAGFCLDLPRERHLSVALMYAPEKTVTGPNLFDPTQQISLSMDQFELEVAYSF
jgi:long-chain fatty acid transport protein